LIASQQGVLKVVPFQVPVKVTRAIADVNEGGVNLLSLQAGVVREGLGAKVVLHNPAVFAEPRTTTLVHQDIAVSHSVGGKPQNGDIVP
jgi:hypothetical protein